MNGPTGTGWDLSVLAPEAGHQPEHGRDQDDNQGYLAEEDEDPRQNPEYPIGHEDADDCEHRHTDGVPEGHWRPVAPAFHVFAHRPNATFPPWPLIRHYVTGEAASSRNQA
jgi:hypothetical protein